MVSGVEDLVDFPLHVAFENPELAKARPDGADFLFTTTGGIKLSHELRVWNPAEGRLVAVVRIPKLSPLTDTTILLWYGNPNADDQQDVEGVWKNR
jgi:hypothetical protein